MYNQIKHLEFIQVIISRMNTNSFQIKGWNVLIVSALLAAFSSTKNELFILIGIFPVVIFWFLDSYYLLQEWKFIGLYNDVAGIRENPEKLKEFEMRPDLYLGGISSYFNAFTSQTVWLLYLPIIFILLCAYTYIKNNCI